MDFFKLRITATKAKAKTLLALMEERQLSELELPAIPMEAIDSFLAGERKNLWEVTINGETLITVAAKKDDATALKMMLGQMGAVDCVLAPIMYDNVVAFIDGERDTLALLEIMRGTEEELPPEPVPVTRDSDLLPGHVK